MVLYGTFIYHSKQTETSIEQPLLSKTPVKPMPKFPPIEVDFEEYIQGYDNDDLSTVESKG